jgi:DNA-binding IclR family transcriptional regulator
MKKTQILEVLEQGPATSVDIADATGLRMRAVSAYLCEMRKAGFVKIAGTLPNAPHGGRPLILYATIES